MVIVGYGNAHVGLFVAILTERYPGVVANLRKCSVGIIPVQVIRAAVIGYEQIDMVAAVKMRPHRCKAQQALRVSDTRMLRNIGKGSVTIVVVERVRGAWK